MLHSMTAYGQASGAFEAWQWDWELRSVNGRGLDLKFRLPDLLAPLEQELRRRAGQKLSRGNVTVYLRLSRTAESTAGSLDRRVLQEHLDMLKSVHLILEDQGLALSPVDPGELLALPGVVRADSDAVEGAEEQLKALALESYDQALEALIQMRQYEGAALERVLNEMVDQVASACQAAIDLGPQRSANQQRVLNDALARVIGANDTVEPERLAQELAVIAVKGDVTEELDRLRIHVGSARDLMASEGPVGRKLDFLTQEFNREANTICSKSQFGPLTQIGLDLKATIDQMREQVQNVE